LSFCEDGDVFAIPFKNSYNNFTQTFNMDCAIFHNLGLFVFAFVFVLFDFVDDAGDHLDYFFQRSLVF